ncbi:MAG TPA: hypothetical protein IAA70_04790 [Candidatus Avoscillospira stercoripullorum]|uniref:Uncharacterized protein n=1 Tax=Candidatus Avoscillospira stercoripullorum TaxID=2840709 RepID=A0A9D1D757_9FIRM|nr:hypothetical protein [Candidatus Avoscillospira stercoripullorum]
MLDIVFVLLTSKMSIGLSVETMDTGAGGEIAQSVAQFFMTKNNTFCTVFQVVFCLVSTFGTTVQKLRFVLCEIAQFPLAQRKYLPEDKELPAASAKAVAAGSKEAAIILQRLDSRAYRQ